MDQWTNPQPEAEDVQTQQDKDEGWKKDIHS